MEIKSLTEYLTYLREYIINHEKGFAIPVEENFRVQLQNIVNQDYSETGALYLALNGLSGGIVRCLKATGYSCEFLSWTGGGGDGDIDNKKDVVNTLKKVWPEFFN